VGTRLLSLPMSPPSLPLWLAILVGAALIPSETLVVDPLAGDEHRAAQP
jgi:hypothetical protein